MIVEQFTDGFAICGDSTTREVQDKVRELVGCFHLIVADPPYGNVLPVEWDKVKVTDETFAKWMLYWTNAWSLQLVDGGAFYVWGGIGSPKFRPFFKYLADVEFDTDLSLANLITWSKRRAYGVSHNYLFTREELAYLCKGDPKKPRVFNIPLLETKRGYAGYNPKYSAKSEYYRRTNVWTDINELFRGKVHNAQKPQRVIEIPIEVHTNTGEWVLDPFAGSGTTAFAARRLGRMFCVIENDVQTFDDMVKRLRLKE